MSKLPLSSGLPDSPSGQSKPVPDLQAIWEITVVMHKVA